MATTNLLEDTRAFIRPETLAQMGGTLGETPETTARASSVGIPTLLAGFAAFGRNEGGASRLFDLLRSRGYTDPGAFSRLAGGPSDALRNEGNGLLGVIFGARLGGIADDLGRATGLRRESIAGLLAMLAPLVMGAIGYRVREGGLDSRGLGALLDGQTPYLRGLVPDSVADHLGMSGLGRTHVRAFDRAEPRRVIAEPERKPWARWLLPILAGGLLLVGLVLFLRAVGDRREARIERDDERVSRIETRRTEGRAPAPVAIRTEEPPMPLVEMPAPAAPEPEGTEELAREMAVDDLRFSHASSDLTAGGESLDRIAGLMKDNPDACLQIEGHTDASGDEEINLRLSQARANVVREGLIRRGVDGERIESAGRGEESPIATNETPEGRERNRRTEVEVESCA